MRPDRCCYCGKFYKAGESVRLPFPEVSDVSCCLDCASDKFQDLIRFHSLIGEISGLKGESEAQGEGDEGEIEA